MRDILGLSLRMNYFLSFVKRYLRLNQDF